MRNLDVIALDTIRRAYIADFFESLGSVDRLLDLGCGTTPFRDLYEPYATASLNMDVAHADCAIDHRVALTRHASQLPFADGEFDVVLCAEVLEQVAEPAAFLAEVRRVLKPGGWLVLTTPFMVPLREEPYDFYRFTRHGIRHLLRTTGFECLQIQVFGDYFGVLLRLLVRPQLRAWGGLARLVQVPWLCSEWNPLIFLLVVLPQYAYAGIRRSSLGQRLLESLDHTAPGYGVAGRRPLAETTSVVSRLPAVKPGTCLVAA